MTRLARPGPSVPQPTRRVGMARAAGGDRAEMRRTIIHEVATAIVLNGTTVAVMMASPLDIEDFALGFAVTEGYIAGPEDVEEFEVQAHPSGVEARFWVSDPCADALKDRRRAMLGPIGCGLCGIESLDQALRDVTPVVSTAQVGAGALVAAFEALRDHQHLHDATRSCHAAGFLGADGVLRAVREDVGRHNALDKLIGALLRAGIPPEAGAIVMTSRLSLELVQKAARVGCPILSGLSGPSAQAVDTARAAQMTLTGFHRGESFDIFCGEGRISG